MIEVQRAKLSSNARIEIATNFIEENKFCDNDDLCQTLFLVALEQENVTTRKELVYALIDTANEYVYAKLREPEISSGLLPEYIHAKNIKTVFDDIVRKSQYGEVISFISLFTM